jgi:O-antigen/teichoic acid export membrane protein
MLLLALQKPTTDVAVYDLAYKVFDFLIALPLFLSNTIYPQLLYAENNLRISFPKLTQFIFIFIILGIIVAIPVWIATPLLSFVRPAFILSAVPLKILLISLPIFFATNILQWILIAKREQLFLLFVYFFSMGINIILNLLFIPQFSYLASAIITGISEAIVFVALFVRLFILRTENRGQITDLPAGRQGSR